MGVGSEVYVSVEQGRKGIGIELKPSYYNQAVKNIESLNNPVEPKQGDLSQYLSDNEPKDLSEFNI